MMKVRKLLRHRHADQKKSENYENEARKRIGYTSAPEEIILGAAVSDNEPSSAIVTRRFERMNALIAASSWFIRAECLVHGFGCSQITIYCGFPIVYSASLLWLVFCCHHSRHLAA